MNPSQTGMFSGWSQLSPAAWLLVFMFLMVTGATASPQLTASFLALAALGWAYLVLKTPVGLRQLLQVHRSIFTALLIFAICIVWSEAYAWKGQAKDFLKFVPAQVGAV